MTKLSKQAILICLVAFSPSAESAEKLYFPPPGESLVVQSRRTPEQAGFHPAVVRELAGSGSRWALWRYGRLVHVEGDFNEVHDVASNRKTWHALAVGAAIQQGRIPSVRQKVSLWNPELGGNHADATWWHVITQSAGFDYPYGDYPAYRPGEMWTYSDFNPVHLCNALARVYGRKGYKDDYASVVKEAYFDAIGLQGWETIIKKDPGFSGDDDGIRFAFDLEDMGRLGLLVLAHGDWDGRQLIPWWFVEALETKQTSGMRVNYNAPNDGTLQYDAERFPEAPYGFMTWVNTDGDLYPGADRGWATAVGVGGHRTMWNHSLGIVFAVAGSTDRPGRSGAPNILEANLE